MFDGAAPLRVGGTTVVCGNVGSCDSSEYPGRMRVSAVRSGVNTFGSRGSSDNSTSHPPEKYANTKHRSAGARFAACANARNGTAPSSSDPPKPAAAFMKVLRWRSSQSRWFMVSLLSVGEEPRVGHQRDTDAAPRLLPRSDHRRRRHQ